MLSSNRKRVSFQGLGLKLQVAVAAYLLSIASSAPAPAAAEHNRSHKACQQARRQANNNKRYGDQKIQSGIVVLDRNKTELELELFSVTQASVPWCSREFNLAPTKNVCETDEPDVCSKDRHMGTHYINWILGHLRRAKTGRHGPI